MVRRDYFGFKGAQWDIQRGEEHYSAYLTRPKGAHPQPC